MDEPRQTPILSYGTPLSDGAATPPRRWELDLSIREWGASACLVVALICGVTSFVQLRRAIWTSAYADYVMVGATHRADPSFVAPPFVGRKYVYESVWELWTTYVALAAGVGSVAFFALEVRQTLKGRGRPEDGRPAAPPDDPKDTVGFHPTPRP